MTVEELRGLVGQSYQKLGEQGKALGCMAPVYALYPDIPRYEWPSGDFTAYVMELLKKHGKPVPSENMKPGDVLAFRMPFNFLHIGVYLGNDEIIHILTGETMETCRLSHIARRVEGVFRWDSYHGQRD